MKDKIVEHIKNKYQPDAIILHGSRARGYERELSDWDIVLLFNTETTFKSGRELFENQNIEFSVHTLPIADIFETFSSKLQNAVVLYERNDEGRRLLNEAIAFYAKGVHWSHEKLEAHKLWFQGRLDGMKNYVDTPEIFYKYFGDIYDRVFNYWYWLKQKRHSQPVYVALKDIQQLDPEYYNLLLKLTDQDTSLEMKVETSEKIRDYLFLREVGLP